VSGFGGFCPLPLRLGGSPTEGWSATQHARVAADLSALNSAATFARITFTITAGVVTIVDYQGTNGNGLAHAPAAISGGTGLATLFWDRAIEDDYEVTDITSILHARATAHGSTMAVATVEVTSSAVVEIRRYNAAGSLADGKVSVTVSGGSRGSRIGHYDGATDKTDAAREEIPYAYAWYNEYTGALGDGFTQNRTGLVHCRKLALARTEAAVERGAEKINANSHPNTADDMLGEWVEILKVRLRGDETRQEIRQLCAAKFEATTGNDSASIDRLCERILGSNFVGVTRVYGTTLDTPPSNTYWPGINPALAAYDLGGGTWFSERSQLVVSVNRPADTTDELFDKRLNVDLFLELDRVLPAHCTFAKSVLDDGGFHLDVDPMDGKGMT
jgi:hypothetical protein